MCMEWKTYNGRFAEHYRIGWMNNEDSPHPEPPPRRIEPGGPPPRPHMPFPPPPPKGLISPLILKALILRILRDSPSYGYDIVNKINDILGSRVPRSVIYYHLNAAERLGFVVSKWEVSGKKARKMYYITDSGEAFLEDAKKKLERLRNVIEYIYS